ncbi:MAG: hypothetical protein C5B58_05505 [Acidobacteria bacterium]|nr:MAG: hypothetical protein C5B58_05505 [Acidobacteriota bacterium]
MICRSNIAPTAESGSSSYGETTQIRLATKWRLGFAVALIALEFSGLTQFATYGSRDLFHTSSAKVHISSYSFQALAYLIAAVVSVLDPRLVKKLFAQPIFRWTVVTMAVFAWGMFIRAFNPPAAIQGYEFVRVFLIRLNALGFMLTCVIMFEGEMVLRAAKRAVVLSTLFTVVVNICELTHFWIFSTAGLYGNRAVGLYDNPNAAGVALVFGCVIGFSAVPRRWRELFILACSAGVAATFSREAMVALLSVILSACWGRAVSVPRMLIMVAAAVVVVVILNFGTALQRQGVLNPELQARLALGLSDRSARHRARIVEEAWQQFERAPLIGNGFGTTAFWAGELESHNLYLSFMADYGVLGVLLVPALVLCLAHGSWDYYGFAFAVLVWCMFNSDFFIDPFAQISLAIVANQRACFRSLSIGQYVTPVAQAFAGADRAIS